MEKQFERTVRLIGETRQRRLLDSAVAIFGVGGVGSFVAEALCRAGVGKLTFIDADVVDVTNINRQLVATHSTVGQPKCQVMARRALDINPHADVTALQMFYDAQTADEINLSKFDYVVDAIDSVTSKILLITRCAAAMGAGNKLDPTRFQVSDISKTSVCPLARVMRRELKKRGVEHLKVVYSQESPVVPAGDPRLPSSISFVPSAAGLVLAGAVVRDLMDE